MIDVRRLLLTFAVLSLMLSLVACVSTTPDTGKQTTAQTDRIKSATEKMTQAETEIVTETNTQETTEPATTEEITTYGELHFPESEN